VEKLQTALEELRVTEEELRTQNEELAAAREELDAQRRRYRALFEFAPDAYLVTDPTGKILEANRAAAALFHVRAQYLVGKPLLVFVHEEDRREFRERLGQPFYAAVTVGAERGAGGSVLGLRWLVRDVTAQKQAERLAAIGQMVAGLAHESRNALQRSEACLERLRFRLAEQPEALDLVGRIQKAHDDLRRLFEDVRLYARPLQLECEAHDLGEIWRESWAQLAVRREGRDAALEEHADGLDLVCLCDRFRLQQVFWNVFDNALAASPDPVRIAVACAETSLAGKRALSVAVRDNGPGLSDEQRQKIFEPFFTTKVRGTGLGMAIAKRIVEAHEGEIAVGRNDPPGAEIVIILPVRLT
jgi:nitrogen fixation/metabolism regulation signal transduction histidine kinase